MQGKNLSFKFLSRGSTSNATMHVTYLVLANTKHYKKKEKAYNNNFSSDKDDHLILKDIFNNLVGEDED